MKKVIISAIIAITAFACKKSTETKTEAPVKYYFKIEAVDADGTQSTITTYKTITVN
jgi:hypothetical protein